MANITNITLAILLAATMTGAMVKPQGHAGVNMTTAITMNNN